MNNDSGVRRPFVSLAMIVSLLGLGTLVLSWQAFPLELSVEFACLLLAALISENYSVGMGGYSFSIAYPLTMATLVLCGPTPALLVALVTSVNVVDLRRSHWTVTAYNVGQLLLCTSLAAWAYVSLGGRVLLESGGQPFGRSDFPQMILPLIVTAVVGSLGNIGLASLGVSIKGRVPLADVLESVGALPLGQFALGVVGFIIAQVMAIHVAAFALFIFPLLVARQFYQRFTVLQSAFTDTIRSLIGALEAKDPYTRGHSERVAEYAVMIGRASGLDPKALADLEKAALLHDLGKLSLPGAVLRKAGALTEEEWEAIRSHPEVGAAMVRRIPPLRRLAEVVEQHHERLDGSGYPNGLLSEQLSHAVRILAVADSFDAMTSDRPYRPGLLMEEALAELKRCAPTQLDADTVEALANALPDPTPTSTVPDASIVRTASHERAG